MYACAKNSHIRCGAGAIERGANDRVASAVVYDPTGSSTVPFPVYIYNISEYINLSRPPPLHFRHSHTIVCVEEKKQDITRDTNPDTCVFFRICQQLFIPQGGDDDVSLEYSYDVCRRCRYRQTDVEGRRRIFTYKVLFFTPYMLPVRWWGG